MINVINALAERTIENRSKIKINSTQRRVSVVDLYGVEYLRQGDADNPATFYISVPPDLEYYQRFDFKLQIMPFVSTVKGASVSGSISETSLEVSLEDTVNGTTLVLGTPTVTPNPHTHTASVTVDKGVSYTSTVSTSWRMVIDGVDISPYLVEQHDGNWIDGEGIYPTNDLDDREDFYDILDVACMLNAEGETEKVYKLLAPEFKKVEIYSDAPFQVAASLYMKFSHMNR